MPWARICLFISLRVVGVIAATAAGDPAPEPPHVRILATDPTALEGPQTSTGGFTVLRDGGTNQDLKISFAISGTATNGVDYVKLSPEITIPAGFFAANVIVQPIDNGVVETNKTVVLTLISNAAYQFGSPRSATVTIVDNRFNSVPPTIRLSSPANGAIFKLHENVALAAEAVDHGGSIQKVIFYGDNRVLGSPTKPPFSLVWTNPPPGSHTLFAVLQATFGDSAVSPLVRIVVSNVPPVVKWISPTNGAKFTLPESVTLSAEASDSDDTVTEVSFFANGRSLGTVAASPYRFLWQKPAAGKYTLVAKAKDTYGALGQSAPVLVEIATNRQPRVKITLPNDLTTFNTRTNFTINVEATDDDGEVRLVEVFANGISLGAPVRTPKKGIYEYVWTDVPPANYTLTATATDDRGAVSVSLPVQLIYATGRLTPEAVGSVLVRMNPSLKLETDPSLAVSYTNDTAHGRQFQQAYAEFLIPRVPPGLANATLVLKHGASAFAGPYTLSYYSADLAVNTNDFADTVHALLDFSTDPQSPRTLQFDVTALVRQFGGTNLGFQIKLAGDPAFSDKITRRIQLTDPQIFFAATGNLPPIVRIADPVNGATLVAPQNILISASTKDVDGSVSRVEFFANAKRLGVSTFRARPDLFRFNWRNIAPGGYDLTATAVDNLGSITVSLPVHIDVLPPIAPAAPLAPSSGKPLVGQPSSGVTVTGPPPPAVSVAVTGFTSGGISLTIDGPIGSRVALEASIDFSTWVPLAVLTNQIGTLRFTDSDTSRFSQRFYRFTSDP